MLAPKGDKAFVRGVTAYMQGNHEQAFAALEEARALDPDSRHVGEELFAGMSLVGLQRVSEAVPYFESVLASDHTIPDPIMAKYNIGGSIQISVTPLVMVDVPLSNVAVALILAEAYQLSNQRQKAIELLESLGAEAEDVAVFALSLADLYAEANEWNDVVRVTEGVQTNEDDVTLHVLTFRAEALNELGMTDGALAITKEALRTKKRLRSFCVWLGTSVGWPTRRRARPAWRRRSSRRSTLRMPDSPMSPLASVWRMAPPRPDVTSS